MELPFTDPEFEKIWQEWIEYRNEHPNWGKYKPTGLKKTFSHLKEISNNNVKTAIQIINYSMAQGYRGLFPLNNKNGTYIQTTNQGGKPGTSVARVEALKKW